mmetsp:Transcript_17166/g.47248  ORF Transcript_17166/g.47248 Transcript_17166/m.47248 type:complete len:160 (-) Transcript_17166:153-632(-)
MEGMATDGMRRWPATEDLRMWLTPTKVRRLVLGVLSRSPMEDDIDIDIDDALTSMLDRGVCNPYPPPPPPVPNSGAASLELRRSGESFAISSEFMRLFPFGDSHDSSDACDGVCLPVAAGGMLEVEEVAGGANNPIMCDTDPAGALTSARASSSSSSSW